MLESTTEKKKLQNYKKKAIPLAIRQQVWLINCGETFKTKCKTTWCKNIISVFDFQCGHKKPPDSYRIL